MPSVIRVRDWMERMDRPMASRTRSPAMARSRKMDSRCRALSPGTMT